MFRLFHYVFTCLVVLIFILLLLLIALALAGVKIPYLSAVLYKGTPKLERPVYASTQDGQEKLAKIIEGQVLILDESEFSSLLSAGFSAKSQSIKSVKANVYIDKIKMLIIIGKKNDYYLSLELTPVSNSTKFKIDKASIGYLRMPIFLAKWILATGNEFDLSNVFKTYGLKIKNVLLSDREIKISFEKISP